MSSHVDDSSTEDGSDALSDSNDGSWSAYVGVKDGNPLLKYDGLPHLMGKAPVAVFSVRPTKDKVCFKSKHETYSGPDDDEFQWHCVISDTLDNNSLGGGLPEKKTKHKGGLKSNFVSNDCPVESDRQATICTFLARGFANFLKLQVDSSRELEDNYVEAIIGSNIGDGSDVDASPGHTQDTLTQEGGTDRYAQWYYGLNDCTALLESVMPQLGTYLIDIDNDTISFFDKKTYEWLWKTHEGVDPDDGQGCIYIMNCPSAMIENIYVPLRNGQHGHKV